MRPVRDDGSRDGHLIVILDVRLDTGGGTDQRVRAIGRHHQPRADMLRAAGLAHHGEFGTLAGDRKIFDPRRNAALHPVCCSEAPPQRRSDHPVGNDIAERLDALLARAEPRAAEPAGIGDVNGADLGRLGREAIPDAEPLEDAPAGVSERRGALIETRLRGGVRRHGLDEQHAHTGAGKPEREARTHQAAPDDCNVELARCPASAPLDEISHDPRP